jgi:hypothetical protein
MRYFNLDGRMRPDRHQLLEDVCIYVCLEVAVANPETSLTDSKLVEFKETQEGHRGFGNWVNKQRNSEVAK